MDTTKQVRLSEIAELITKGTTPTTLGFDFQDEGINFLKIECFSENGSFMEDKVAHISEECYEKLKRSQLEVGDILFSIAGAIGRVAMVTEEMLPANTNQALSIIRIKRKDIYLPYIKLVLTSPFIKAQFERKKQGVAQLNISLKDISELTIPFPEIDKQREYVTIFDCVLRITSACQQKLQKLDELVKSRFVEMFGDPTTNSKNWKRVRFDSLCENLDGKRRPITSTDREAGLYPYYGASGIVDHVAGFIFDEDILLVSEDGANLLARSTPIAFSVSGKVWVNNHAHVLRFNNFALQKYVEYYFSMINIDDYITGSTQPKLNQAKLNSMMIPLPSDSLQEVFMRFVAEVDKSKLAVKQSLEKLETLKKSLMQQYFG